MEKIDSKEDPLERQIIRGTLFTHTALGKQSERVNEIESFLYGAIDLMIKKGIIKEKELSEAAKEVKKESYEKGEQAFVGVGIRIEEENEEKEFTPVNCEERMHICKAVCCKLNFALSVEEIESGNAKWDLGQPYFIRHEKTGYCTHIDSENSCCSIYKDRPKVCKKYSCANDQRIWKDFEKMELNTEWIEENLQERKIQLQAVHMIPGSTVEYQTETKS